MVQVLLETVSSHVSLNQTLNGILIVLQKTRAK